jgi:acetyl-CoA carboxylase biotin carboxyl carrier protein
MKKKETKGKAAGASPKLSAVAAIGSQSGASRSRSATSSALDLETVRELARIIGEFGLSEVEADPSGHVRVRRELGGGAGGVHLAPPGASPPIGLAPPPPVEGAPEAGTFVTSPFVGTFYRAPSPETASFVEVGQNVRKGQVVCIVEAMKLMNEIESEADGKIAEILAKNGEHVEYGQHLFRLA